MISVGSGSSVVYHDGNVVPNTSVAKLGSASAMAHDSDKDRDKDKEALNKNLEECAYYAAFRKRGFSASTAPSDDICTKMGRITGSLWK
jgi:Na+-transporting NADH:ubiquinone oxidoreductase subunit NqrA